MTVIGNVMGKTCIIVDDICNTAGTLCKAAKVLLENAAVGAHSDTTHGVLCGPAVERAHSLSCRGILHLSFLPD